MIEFEILARGLYRPNQITITYNPNLTMPTTPTIQQWMDTLWQQKLTLAQQKNIPLYNTPLFRLIHAKTQPNGNPVHSRPGAAGAADHPAVADCPGAADHPAVADCPGAAGAAAATNPLVPSAPSLHLTLGNTTYKEYVTTRELAFAHNRPREALSNALSVCSVVETTDRYILLDKRQGVDVYPGRYHVIGGFFERDLDTTETIETIETIETSATSATSATNPDPFAAIRREIREETGIQAADIVEQYCLGVLYDLATPHAEFCFLTRLNIPLNEVHQRVPEENEIKQLLSLYVTEESLRNFILTNHGNISATGEPNLLLYGALNFGEAWFEEIMGRL